MSMVKVKLVTMLKETLSKFKVNSLSLKLVCLTIAITIILLDQWTKHLAVEYLQFEGNSVAYLPHFNLTLFYNKGAAFGLLSDAGVWGRLLLAVISITVSTGIVIWLLMIERTQKLEIAALTLILAGAIGNLYDRVTLGMVVDFVDWFYYSDSCLPLFGGSGTCHWPTFNIADVAISFGAFLLILDLFFGNKKPAEKASKSEE